MPFIVCRSFRIFIKQHHDYSKTRHKLLNISTLFRKISMTNKYKTIINSTYLRILNLFTSVYEPCNRIYNIHFNHLTT